MPNQYEHHWDEIMFRLIEHPGFYRACAEIVCKGSISDDAASVLLSILVSHTGESTAEVAANVLADLELSGDSKTKMERMVGALETTGIMWFWWGVLVGIDTLAQKVEE